MAHYFVAFNRDVRGPYTLEQLVGMKLAPTTLIWRKGMPQWAPVKDLPEVRAALEGPPPAVAVPPVKDVAPVTSLPSTPPPPRPPGKTESSIWSSSGKAVGGFLLFVVLVGRLVYRCQPKPPPSSPVSPTSYVPAPSPSPVARIARIDVKWRDATSELMQVVLPALTDEQKAALGISVLMTGMDDYASKVTITNTGNVPVKVFPQNILMYFGDESATVTTLDHASFLRPCVVQPGYYVEGLVIYRARVDIGASIRFGSGALSYRDDTVTVTYNTR